MTLYAFTDPYTGRVRVKGTPTPEAPQMPPYERRPPDLLSLALALRGLETRLSAARAAGIDCRECAEEYREKLALVIEAAAEKLRAEAGRDRTDG